MKKLLLTSASAIVLAAATPVISDDTDAVVGKVGNVFVEAVKKKGIFQWVEGQFGYADKKVQYSFTGFKVLSENKSTVNYAQASFDRKGAQNTLNLGVGIRNRSTFADKESLFGFNFFLDTKDGSKRLYNFNSKDVFQRISLGFELKTGAFDFSSNYYSPVGESIILNEKVMKGYDATAKGHISNAFNIGLTAYKFMGVTSKVEQGNKLIAEFKPNSLISVRAEYDKPNTGKAKIRLHTGVRFAFDTPLADQLKPLAVKGNAWAKRYDKVERRYEILTESLVSIDTFSMPSVLEVGYSSGTVTITEEQILAKLQIDGDQTKKSDWTLKSLAEKTDYDNLAVDQKTLKVSGAQFKADGVIVSGAIVLATLSHQLYNDVVVELRVKTVTAGSIITEQPDLSATWGKEKSWVQDDYNFITSQTINGVTETWALGNSDDFTFEVIAPDADVNLPAGLEKTTQGIAGNNLASVIESDTGKLRADKTVKSGKLLISITRKEKTKDSVLFPEAKSLINITLEKQSLQDKTITVASGLVWKGESEVVKPDFKIDTIAITTANLLPNAKYTIKSTAPNQAVSSKAIEWGQVNGLGDYGLKNVGKAGTVVVTITPDDSNTKYKDSKDVSVVIGDPSP